MSLILFVLQNSEMYQCLAREGWTRTIGTEMRHQVSYCMQCQGWRMRTCISSSDACMTSLCVEEKILPSLIRMSVLCIGIFYRSSRFVKPEEDIWISGFTSCTNTGHQISAYYFSTEPECFVLEKHLGYWKLSALCNALFCLSWWILIHFPCCPNVPWHSDGNCMHFRGLIGIWRLKYCKTDHPSYLIHATLPLSDVKHCRQLCYESVWDHI